MLADVVDALACPHCGAPLTLRAGAPAVLACANRHTFDVARQGYVNLLRGSGRSPGDTAGMVQAREEFLAAGHYAPLARAVVEAVQTLPALPRRVLEVGAGTGYYLASVLDAVPGERAAGIALDVSVPALRRAARAHPRIGAVVADSWQRLPVLDGAVDVVLDVFAPRNPAELHRVLRRDGLLVVVTPGPGHLRELVEALGLLAVEPGKEDRLDASLAPLLALEERRRVVLTLRLDTAAVAALVGMGPSAWHQDPADLAVRVAALPLPVAVTVEAAVSRYRRR